MKETDDGGVSIPLSELSKLQFQYRIITKADDNYAQQSSNYDSDVIYGNKILTTNALKKHSL